jgi:hypothetical protein
LKEIQDDFPHLPIGCSIILERRAKEIILENISAATSFRRNQILQKTLSCERIFRTQFTWITEMWYINKFDYLTIAYNFANQTDKYCESLLETVEKFPGYIFGKISLSEYYLNNNEFNKIPGLLDNKFEITQHYPLGTVVFHISAVRGFYYITGRYFAKAGKIEMAFRSYFLLCDLDRAHQTTELLGEEI